MLLDIEKSGEQDRERSEECLVNLDTGFQASFVIDRTLCGLQGKWRGSASTCCIVSNKASLLYGSMKSFMSNNKLDHNIELSFVMLKI